MWPSSLVVLCCGWLSCIGASTLPSGTVPRRSRASAFRHHITQTTGEPLPSTVNCTWRTIEQRLDHFGNSPSTFLQRFCLYSSFWQEASSFGAAGVGKKGPIFFYTGNESPLDVYINNTGLMWEMGRRKGALLVFAEHRYEPASHPCMENTPNCFSYGTTAQALMDYVVLIQTLKAELQAEGSPVIAFGGSYGGMLAGWFRIRYPDVIAGSIAASAPVWGLADTMQTDRLDWTSRAISRGVSAAGGASDRCLSNLRSAWPLMQQVARTEKGLELLGQATKSCSKLKKAEDLIEWAQSPWFELAEGNYPFASTYITYAVGPGYFPLPPWPMRVACAKGLDSDLGVELTGSVEDVRYSVRMGELVAEVDWDHADGNGEHLLEQQIKDSGVLELAVAVREAVAVWYNVSGELACFDIGQDEQESSSEKSEQERPDAAKPSQEHAHFPSCPACPPCQGCPACPVSNCSAGVCNYTKPLSLTFSWDLITCNDDIWLYNGEVQGVGHDMFWPPNVKRGATVEDVVGPRHLIPGCKVAPGLAGAPKLSDPWSSWAIEYYRGSDISKVRNIVWSNGLLDPWSGGGVYPPGGGIFGPLRQNISADGSQAALLIDLGGHHLDLFFAHPEDPPSVREVRRIEEELVTQWCQEWYWSGYAPHTLEIFA